MASSTVLFLAIITLPFQRVQSSRLRPLALYAISFIVFLLVAYNLADISYFSEVKRHIGAEVMNITADLGEMASLAFNSRLDTLL
ncbi:MAG: hypothetical protein SOX43_00325, partial [Pelistega sp.]|nr:hypothetical protein [Pelistega sp.]